MLHGPIPRPLLFHPLTPASPEAPPRLLVEQQRGELVPDLLRRPPIDDIAGLALANSVRRSPAVTRDAGQAAGRRLEVDDSQAFDVRSAEPGPTRHREHVSHAVVRRQV